MMRDVILNFPEQLQWNPRIENEGNLERKEIAVVCGMGGSHLAADFLSAWDPSLDIIVHKEYDLRGIPESVLSASLIVVASYSGNTEEAVSAFLKAKEKNLAVAVIAKGGALLELAKKESAPYARVPDTGIQPRAALGFCLLALLKILGKEDMLKEAQKIADMLRPEALERKGMEIAEQIAGKTPIFYASGQNYPFAFSWKIRCNEGAKIPAFCSEIPEANHNEMTGFDIMAGTKVLSEKFCFIFLTDDKDDIRIQKRMSITMQMYEDRGFQVLEVPLEGGAFLDRAFSSLITADWVALRLSEIYGTEPEQVPMVEEFKRRMAR
ncbi:MAG: hypothetical protein HY482_00665 [Candidatus Wildermuthbacteria bacterium]|nr:hypothetical protein [Candidatus Wildermuthbacteria bacterium]